MLLRIEKQIEKQILAGLLVISQALLSACGVESSDKIQPRYSKSSTTGEVQFKEVYPIYRTYFLTFDETRNTTRFSAHFRSRSEWGSTVELMRPSQVVFEGLRLDKSDATSAAFWLGLLVNPVFFLVGGISYSGEVTGPPRPSYQIEWVDPSGVSVYDKLQLTPVNVVVETPSFSKTGHLEGRVFSLGVPASVSLTVKLTQSKGGHQTVEIFSDINGRFTVSFSDPTIVSGPAKIEFEAKTTRVLDNSRSKGGSAYLSYLTRPVGVTIQ